MVANYCKRNHLPLLPAIVVSKSDGVPGGNYPGYQISDEFGAFKERSRVFAFDWFSRKEVPNVEDFRK